MDLVGGRPSVVHVRIIVAARSEQQARANRTVFYACLRLLCTLLPLWGLAHLHEYDVVGTCFYDELVGTRLVHGRGTEGGKGKDGRDGGEVGRGKEEMGREWEGMWWKGKGLERWIGGGRKMEKEWIGGERGGREGGKKEGMAKVRRVAVRGGTKG